MTQIAMIVSNRHDPDPRVHKEAIALTDAGYHVTIYAFDRMHELPQNDMISGVAIKRIRVQKSPIGNLAATAIGLVAFRNAVKKELLKSKPTVIHCHDQDTCAVGLWWKILGSKKAHVKEPKFIFDAHDLYWTWLLMADPKSLIRKFGAQILKAQGHGYAKAADLVITVTQGSKRHPGTAEVFQNWGINPKVIWNAPDEPLSIPPMPRQFTLGYIGSIREPAMFDWLIDAMSILTPKERPSLFVAGGGAAADVVIKKLAVASDKLGFSLKTTGRFSLDKIPTLIANTSIQYCVYPQDRGNISRAMPVKLLDSVAYKRPVIGNKDTLMGDWIQRNKWGYQVPQANPEALAAALRSARTDISNGTFNKMPTGPMWHKESKKLVNAYNHLL